MQDQPQREPVQPIPYAIPSRQLYHPLAIASLICGLLFFLPLLAAVLAIVFGWMARGRIANNPQYRGRGMALAGMILGTLSIVGFFGSIPLMLESQRQRNRIRCMSNLRQISLATIMYSNDNKARALPPDPSPLNKYLGNSAVWICPECQQPVAGGGGGGVASSYIYLGSKLGPSMRKLRYPSQTILAYEPLSNHDGRGFCAVFLDGHCEWVPKERAAAVMQQIQLSIVNPTTQQVGN
ncbi:MAG TPA: DUF4190 domain-containing protein [Tepidisphaeraceae bacterium]|nr:DUF4190 domain-containing protein [Tepidisphaeraceae bacterium]